MDKVLYFADDAVTSSRPSLFVVGECKGDCDSDDFADMETLDGGDEKKYGPFSITSTVRFFVFLFVCLFVCFE